MIETEDRTEISFIQKPPIAEIPDNVDISYSGWLVLIILLSRNRHSLYY